MVQSLGFKVWGLEFSSKGFSVQGDRVPQRVCFKGSQGLRLRVRASDIQRLAYCR